MIGPLWGEPDEAKRIDGYKAVDKHIAEEGEVIPLLQYVQPIIVRKGLTLVPQASGQLLPQTVTGRSFALVVRAQRNTACCAADPGPLSAACSVSAAHRSCVAPRTERQRTGWPSR